MTDRTPIIIADGAKLQRLAHEHADDVMRRVHRHCKKLGKLYADVDLIRLLLERLPPSDDNPRQCDRLARVELLRAVQNLSHVFYGDYRKVDRKRPVFE